jgi:predicted DNA-binding protein
MERETTQDEVKHTNLRYLTDEKGKRVGVILGVEEYEALIEELEDIRDAKEVQVAIRRGEEDVLP